MSTLEKGEVPTKIGRKMVTINLNFKDYYLKGYRKTNRPKPCNTCVSDCQDGYKNFICKNCKWNPENKGKK